MKIERTMIQVSDNWRMESGTKIFLLGCFLFKNQRINRDKFLAMCRLSLPEDTTNKRGAFLAESLGILNKRNPNRYHKNAYRCSITKKWYNDESIVVIYEEALNSQPLVHSSIELDELLIYVNLLLNKPKNYCIDHIKHDIIMPIVEYYGYYKKYDELEPLLSESLTSLGYQSYDNYEPNGSFCCEDCDGPYSDYKQQHYETYVSREYIKNINENVEATLNKKRNVWVKA